MSTYVYAEVNSSSGTILFFFFFEAESLTGLESSRLSYSGMAGQQTTGIAYCLCLPSAGVKGSCDHPWFFVWV